ncbi:hypothetical protein A3C57_02730 [Candidatus Nomurabacteria bacterium RIFCSPHIGHO2_02_FULL_33_12]|uniref:SIMPL domain-containing protein n=1 Tax=Candidatus Nomurabacteria bacterium RIFCSPLOWO2_01_FULL_33_17 TaxID=1801764 RepID=A0A1F6WNY6_9BACT|nr:MAG: hypothetical protein A3C57_02730 [Candidatus Nomurabacteria bacterium RIFCSPHIGHO2_02_FULL_33_12]OGI83567.1 MAG: hypothetical protein A2903_02510 [Candidatus Nomurabacteria bacterium RIFCSPLOWO2_01_FULL_33_17]
MEETNNTNSSHNYLRFGLIWLGVILALGMVLMTIIGSFTFLRSKKLGDVVSVTGSATKDVVGDKGNLYISFSRGAKVDSLGADYKLMNNDANTIINYLKKKGFTDADITISSISANQVWDDSEKLNKDYDLRQSIEVNSTNVNLIDTTSKNITMLADDGIVLNVNANYTYSKLADERVGLLSSAIDDARARAEAIADKSGRRIGNIQTASSGVVQVLAPGSIEVQDYGSYDTSTINKTIMVTAKVSFSFK